MTAYFYRISIPVSSSIIVKRKNLLKCKKMFYFLIFVVFTEIWLYLYKNNYLKIIIKKTDKYYGR